MHIAFLTPLASLAVLLALIPLGAFVRLVRRDRHVRGLLSLPAPARVSVVGPAIAIVAAAALIGTAAAQPVVQRGAVRHQRIDAEAYIVFDVSASMAAAPGPNAIDRLERAKRFALALRPRLPTIPVGIASLTDRVLPHLFPTPDERSFATVVDHAIAVGRPPPMGFYADRGTKLGALSELATQSYFDPAKLHRAIVVLTDGESLPVGSALATALHKRPGIGVVFVHVWRSDERIYNSTVPDPGYHSDPASGSFLRDTAASLGGTVVSASDVGGAAAAVRRLLGSGPVRPVNEPARVALMPWVTLAAFFPLAFLLWRRNL